ncbi:hypothetical protein Ga0100230_018085 [Opitutaceae bacterium TAV3]|nr:hypothetical protein Ga0100230_018085 [Opitutaceae bacterium TAV3]
METSRNILLADSSAMRISDMIRTDYCANVTVRGNRMIGRLQHDRLCHGSETSATPTTGHENWIPVRLARRLPRPLSQATPRVPHGTANLVYRDVPDAPPPANRPAHTNAFLMFSSKTITPNTEPFAAGATKAARTIIDAT